MGLGLPSIQMELLPGTQGEENCLHLQTKANKAIFSHMSSKSFNLSKGIKTKVHVAWTNENLNDAFTLRKVNISLEVNEVEQVKFQYPNTG